MGITLDLLEPVEVQPESLKRFGNALGQLERLAVGLGYLYGNVRKSEFALSARMKAEFGDSSIDISGSHPTLEAAPIALIECAMYWYAGSAVNFVRAIGAIGFESDKLRQDEYSKQVLGNISAFRDKIAAHSAGMAVNKNDHEAEQIASLIPSVSWRINRFIAPGYAKHLTEGGVSSSPEAIGAWSLTQMHEELANRFPMIKRSTPNLTNDGL